MLPLYTRHEDLHMNVYNHGNFLTNLFGDIVNETLCGNAL